MNGIGVCIRLLPGSPNGARFMGMTSEHERGLKEQHLEKIQRLAAREVSPDEFSVRGMMLCNTQRDYYYSKFSRAALDEIVEMLPGAPVMRGHSYDTLPVGVFFDARVTKRKGYRDRDAHAVEALYMLPNDDQGAAMRTRIDLGIQREVSIGWRCAGAECSICGEHIYACEHVPGDIYRPAEGQRGAGICDFEFSGITNVLEGSMVFRGGQKDTSTYVPEGADESTAAVAGAASRLVRLIRGDVAWDEIATLKRTAAPDYDLMPLKLRAMVGQYARAAGYGLMCATPGERVNTQALILSRASFETPQQAARWARDHEFRADRKRVGTTEYLFEQQPKDRFEAKSFEDLAIDEGVVARIGKRAKKEEQSEGRSLIADSVEEFLAGASLT